MEVHVRERSKGINCHQVVPEVPAGTRQVCTGMCVSAEYIHPIHTFDNVCTTST